MADDKPLGWHPLTEQERARYREQGLDEEAIAFHEETNIYQVHPVAVAGFALASAILRQLSARGDSHIVDAVRADLARTAEQDWDSERVADRVHARILRSVVDEWDWSKFRH